MTQHELYRQVAEATGESVGAIAAMGFSLLDLSPLPDHRPRVRPRRMGGRGRPRVKRRHAVVTPLHATVVRFHPEHGKGA